MRRFLTAGSAALAIVIPATAEAKPGRRHVIQYERAYTHAARAFGRRAVGCRLLKSCRGRVSDARMVASTRVLHRMFAPVPVESVTSSAPVAVQATVSAVSPGSLPACTWQPESGGNPSAVNPQSGAGGYYQVLPSTWRAYGGTGLPQDAPMSEQTAVAERVMAGQGPSAWVNCGGGR
jgi:hypothetical protein